MVKVLPPPKPDIPEPPPGTAFAVSPTAHKYWHEDHEFYDQMGRDPFQQARIWLMDDPEERVAKLKEVIEGYPKQMHRRLMLVKAVRRGDEALVRCLVATGLKIHPDIPVPPLTAEQEEARARGEVLDRDDDLVIPVHLAAAYGQVGCLKIFLEEGEVGVDVRERNGRTPLMCGTQHPEVVRYLLDQGADPTAEMHPQSWSVLENATEAGNVESLKLLLEHPVHGSTVSRKSRAGEEPGVWVTPVAIELAAKRNMGALKLLLERGAYPMEPQDRKAKGELLSDSEREGIVDAIIMAVRHGSLESLKLLLSYKYPTDEDGNPLPLDPGEFIGGFRGPYLEGAYAAVASNWPDKFEFLNGFNIKEVSFGFNLFPAGQNLNYQHLLEHAARGGAIDSARLLIEKYNADPNGHRMPPGTKPLYLAAANDKPEMVRFLLDSHGADIHLGSGQYAMGPTALWVSITLKSIGSVELLLRRGGPVDHVDEEIRKVSGPMTVVLRAEKQESESWVRLETEETAREYLAKCKGNWQDLNPPFVMLEIGPKDLEWISKLQTRRPAEELREVGVHARELNEAEAQAEAEAGEPARGNIRSGRMRMAAPFPTVPLRENDLRKDDDLLPEFRPGTLA